MNLQTPTIDCRHDAYVETSNWNRVLRRLRRDDSHKRSHYPKGRPNRLTRLFFAATTVLALAACGGQAERTSGSGPTQGAGFASAVFVNLPRPGGATPFDPPSEEGGVWTQSYEVRSLGSAETMQFYVAALQDDWLQQVPPAVVGHCNPAVVLVGDGCTYRGVWASSGQRLEVSAGPDGIDQGNGGGTELSLLLTGQG